MEYWGCRAGELPLLSKLSELVIISLIWYYDYDSNYQFNTLRMKEKLERNLEITKKAMAGATQYSLAKEYNLHPNRIFQIIKNTKPKLSVNQ